jgi:hypothetical protein
MAFMYRVNTHLRLDCDIGDESKFFCKRPANLEDVGLGPSEFAVLQSQTMPTFEFSIGFNPSSTWHQDPFHLCSICSVPSLQRLKSAGSLVVLHSFASLSDLTEPDIQPFSRDHLKIEPNMRKTYDLRITPEDFKCQIY